jgi:catechol 2,3-dioxygenase-like lactoylglutathione lyase family enzyme
MIKSLAFVCYPVKDVEKAAEFYRDVIGLGGCQALNERWVEFDVGGATFAVASGGEQIGLQPGSAFAAAFEVDDLTATMSDLRVKNVRTEEPFEGQKCRACFAYDLDGNRFVLHQLKS